MCSLAGDVPRDTTRIADRTLIMVRHGHYDLSTGQLTALGPLIGSRAASFNRPLLTVDVCRQL